MTRLFIVEDHDIMRRTMTSLLLREPDFTLCGHAATGEEALNCLEQAEPDLVLVDLSLPAMDGLDLLAAIHERWPGLPCVVLSAHDGTYYKDKARVAGAVGYLAKHRVDTIVPGVRRVLALVAQKRVLAAGKR